MSENDDDLRNVRELSSHKVFNNKSKAIFSEKKLKNSTNEKNECELFLLSDYRMK